MLRLTTLWQAASGDDNIFVVEVTDPKDDLRYGKEYSAGQPNSTNLLVPEI